MMEALLAGADHREAVVATVEMEEVERVGREAEVGHLEPEQVAIERERRRDIGHVQHHVAHAVRAGLEAGDRPPGPEWIGRDLRPAEHFHAVAVRIGEADQPRDAPLVGEAARLARYRDAVVLQPAGQAIEVAGRLRLPAEKAESVAVCCGDHEALLAVVHAERARGFRAVGFLHAEQLRGERAPVVELARLDADIAERLQFHRVTLSRSRVPRRSG